MFSRHVLRVSLETMEVMSSEGKSWKKTQMGRSLSKDRYSRYTALIMYSALYKCCILQDLQPGAVTSWQKTQSLSSTVISETSVITEVL